MRIYGAGYTEYGQELPRSICGRALGFEVQGSIREGVQ